MQIQMGRVSQTDRYCSSPSQDHKWETIASGNKSEAIEQFLDFLNDRTTGGSELKQIRRYQNEKT